MWTPNSRVFMIGTPTKRTPNLSKQHFLTFRVYLGAGLWQGAGPAELTSLGHAWG